jgi:hypothetical protein
LYVFSSESFQLTAFQGAFSVSFLATIRILTRDRGHGRKTNITMLIAAILMMTLATGQIIVDTTNIFWAFIDKGSRLERQSFLQDATQPIFAAKHAIYFTMMLLGDSIVASYYSLTMPILLMILLKIYRCFIVWSKNYWVIILPAICSVGSGGRHSIAWCHSNTDLGATVCAYQTIWAVRHIQAATIASETKFGISVLVLSMSANIIATCAPPPHRI